jgi:proteasome lid subunit RPN8/RPN11
MSSRLKGELFMSNDTTRLKIEAKADPEETLITNMDSGDTGGGAQAAATGADAAEASGPLPPDGGAKHGADAGAVALSGVTAEEGSNDNGLKPDKPKVVFGDLIPDEQSSPFPVARLLHWKPTGKKFDAKEPPFRLVITSEVLAMVNSHVSTDLVNELGGFLLGNRYVCPNDKIKYIQIDNCPTAKFTSSGPVSLELVNETFQHFIDEKESKYRGKEAIGWYHSHPDKGAFLSTMDDVVHRSRFPSSWTVALVIDPNRKEGGFFCWRDGNLHLQAMMDFYELRGIKTPPTITYMPWTNYQCFDSQTDEEREPQLAKDVSLDVLHHSPVWPLKLPPWVKEYRTFIGVGGLVFVAIILGLIAGLFGNRAKPDPGSNSNARTAAASPAPTDTSKKDKTSGPAAAPADQSSLQVTVVGMFRRNKYEMAARFNKRPEDLQIQIEGRSYGGYRLNGNEAIVDVSDTMAARSLERPGAASITIPVDFWEANNPGGKVQASLTLFKKDAPIREPRAYSDITSQSTSSAARQSGRQKSRGTVDDWMRRRRKH